MADADRYDRDNDGGDDTGDGDGDGGDGGGDEDKERMMLVVVVVMDRRVDERAYYSTFQPCLKKATGCHKKIKALAVQRPRYFFQFRLCLLLVCDFGQITEYL